MGTALPRTELSRSGLRCGEAALESLGITVRGPQSRSCWGRCLQELRSGGRTLVMAVPPWDAPVSLARFVASHPEGEWLLYTADHIMSLRDGQLTDTDITGTGRRMVREAYLILAQLS